MFEFDSACTQLGAKPIQDPTREGSAFRLAVSQGEQTLQIYGFEDSSLFEVAKASHEVLSHHLFAIPELVDHGVDWFAIDCGQSKPVSEVLTMRGHETLGDLGRSGHTIAHAIGTVLAKLHNVPVIAKFGDPTEREDVKRFLTFSGYVASRLERYHDAVRRRAYSEARVQDLSKAIADLRQELASFHPRTPTSWIHGNPGVESFWVHPETFELTAMTGWEHSCLLPREADITSLLFLDDWVESDGAVKSLYHGYGAARTMDVQRRERFYRRFFALGALTGHLGNGRLDEDRLFELIR